MKYQYRTLSVISSVINLFNVGMLSIKDQPHLACASDEVALFKADNKVSAILCEGGDIHLLNDKIWVASVEFKTMVAAITFGNILNIRVE